MWCVLLDVLKTSFGVVKFSKRCFFFVGGGARIFNAFGGI